MSRPRRRRRRRRCGCSLRAGSDGSYRCPTTPVDGDARRRRCSRPFGSSYSNVAATRAAALVVVAAAVAVAIAAAAAAVAPRYRVLGVETRPVTDGTLGWPAGFSRMSPGRDCSATHTYLGSACRRSSPTSVSAFRRHASRARVPLRGLGPPSDRLQLIARMTRVCQERLICNIPEYQNRMSLLTVISLIWP